MTLLLHREIFTLIQKEGLSTKTGFAYMLDYASRLYQMHTIQPPFWRLNDHYQKLWQQISREEAPSQLAGIEQILQEFASNVEDLSISCRHRTLAAWILVIAGRRLPLEASFLEQLRLYLYQVEADPNALLVLSLSFENDRITPHLPNFHLVITLPLLLATKQANQVCYAYVSAGNGLAATRMLACVDALLRMDRAESEVYLPLCLSLLTARPVPNGVILPSMAEVFARYHSDDLNHKWWALTRTMIQRGAPPAKIVTTLTGGLSHHAGMWLAKRYMLVASIPILELIGQHFMSQTQDVAEVLPDDYLNALLNLKENAVNSALLGVIERIIRKPELHYLQFLRLHRYYEKLIAEVTSSQNKSAKFLQFLFCFHLTHYKSAQFNAHFAKACIELLRQFNQQGKQLKTQIVHYLTERIAGAKLGLFGQLICRFVLISHYSNVKNEVDECVILNDESEAASQRLAQTDREMQRLLNYFNGDILDKLLKILSDPGLSIKAYEFEIESRPFVNNELTLLLLLIREFLANNVDLAPIYIDILKLHKQKLDDFASISKAKATQSITRDVQKNTNALLKENRDALTAVWSKFYQNNPVILAFFQTFLSEDECALHGYIALIALVQQPYAIWHPFIRMMFEQVADYPKAVIALLKGLKRLLQDGTIDLESLSMVWIDKDNNNQAHSYVLTLVGFSDPQVPQLFCDCLFAMMDKIIRKNNLPAFDAARFFSSHSILGQNVLVTLLSNLDEVRQNAVITQLEITLLRRTDHPRDILALHDLIDGVIENLSFNQEHELIKLLRTLQNKFALTRVHAYLELRAEQGFDAHFIQRIACVEKFLVSGIIDSLDAFQKPLGSNRFKALFSVLYQMTTRNRKNAKEYYEKFLLFRITGLTALPDQRSGHDTVSFNTERFEEAFSPCMRVVSLYLLLKMFDVNDKKKIIFRNAIYAYFDEQCRRFASTLKPKLINEDLRLLQDLTWLADISPSARDCIAPYINTQTEVAQPLFRGLFYTVPSPLHLKRLVFASYWDKFIKAQLDFEQQTSENRSLMIPMQIAGIRLPVDTAIKEMIRWLLLQNRALTNQIQISSLLHSLLLGCHKIGLLDSTALAEIQAKRPLVSQLADYLGQLKPDLSERLLAIQEKAQAQAERLESSSVADPEAGVQHNY